MAITLTLIDAFASQPFSGNQAAVAVLDQPADEAWMQAVASELRLPETAFCWPEGSTYRLRWFTPTVEVDLCGHATLAAAAALWADGHLHREDPVAFDTRSGPLSCRRNPVGDIDLDLPLSRPTPADTPLDWARLGLATPPSEVFAGSGAGSDGFLVAVGEQASWVRQARPDLTQLERSERRPLVLTAPGDGPVHVVSRVFAPTLGIDEGPVTGSAHALLAPYWMGRLGAEELVCHQASSRGGDLRARIVEDRVMLTGRAVVMGHLMLTQAASPLV
ncbi:MAG: PhzF family phenazine biosynthesis protein [Microthrixaceae bacterium]